MGAEARVLESAYVTGDLVPTSIYESVYPGRTQNTRLTRHTWTQPRGAVARADTRVADGRVPRRYLFAAAARARARSSSSAELTDTPEERQTRRWRNRK